MGAATDVGRDFGETALDFSLTAWCFSSALAGGLADCRRARKFTAEVAAMDP